MLASDFSFLDGPIRELPSASAAQIGPAAIAASFMMSADAGNAIKQLERSEVRAEIVKEGGKARIATLATPKYVYEAEFSKGEVEVTAEGKIIKVEK